MINPNISYESTGKIISIEKMTSMTVYKVKVKDTILDYTEFGMYQGNELRENDILTVELGFSITLNGYFIKAIEPRLTVVA